MLLANGLLTAGFGGLRHRTATQAGDYSGLGLRGRLVHHLLGLHAGFHDRADRGDVLTRITADVNTIGGFIDLIVTWVAHVVALVLIVLFMFRMDPELALIGTAFFPVVVLLVGAVWWAYESRTAALRKATAKLTGILHESIFGVRVIKGFGVEKHQRSRYAPASDAIVALGMALARLDTAYTVCGESLPALAMVAVLWWGGVRTLSGDLTVGVLLAFGAWMVQLAGRTEGVLERFAWMMQARVSARRINALLAVAPVIADPPRPSVLPPVGGTLRFANVTLAFGERRVLDSLSLEVRTGEVLVLVGMSGSGKSMLLNLPPRLYDPRDGVVHLDGTDVRELPLEDLCTAVCLVSDDDMLFPDTIAATIALGLPGASRTAIEHAARLAQAHEFIKAMPEGYDAMVGERYLARLRNRVFEHLSALPLCFYDAHNTGELIARASDDVQAISGFVCSGLSRFLIGGLLLVLGVGVMGGLSLPLLAVCLLAVPIIQWLLSRRFLRQAEPVQRRVRERYAATLSLIKQGLSGARLLQLFRREQTWADAVDCHLDDEHRVRMHAVTVRNSYFPWLSYTWVFITAAIIGAGAGLNSAGMVTIGVVSAFVLSLTRIFGPLENLSRLFGDAQSAKASLGRIFALLDVPLEIREHPDATDLPPRGNLETANVAFAYIPGRPVLRDISLRVRPGETLALVGATGAGKSTLARLLARLYDPDEGQVSFAGLDLKDASLSSVRQRIVLLPQEGHLFRGTVADNMRLSRPEASDTEVANIVRDLGLEERFRRFPNGLLTEVDERGTRLSAGERQLISLVRVALANPEVAILDEALSNVDPGTEALVQRTMRRLMEGRTVIVIAHRETTAQRADRVAFLEHGVLAAQGRHNELLRAVPAYAGLWGQGGDHDML